MKVLQRNEETVPSKWIKAVFCSGCSSKLEVNEGDLSRFKGYSPRGGGSSWDYASFQCPLCDEWVSVTVPKKVLSRLKVSGVAPHTGVSGARGRHL